MTDSVPPQMLDKPTPASLEMDTNSPALTGVVQYLDVLGKPISSEELITGLPIVASDFDMTHAKRAFARLGFVCELREARRVRDADLPVCIETKDGRFLTVLGREGDLFTLAHPVLPDAVWTRSSTEFYEDYSGTYLAAAATVAALEEKRVGAADQGHWFWRHLVKQRWISFEIFIATLVANGLAIAVSLFALQVYDRVIPNASVQTLWVLAIGALIAIIFEAILRISRGRLIDDMGRQLEMEVSADLISKLQGMRLSQRQMGAATLGSMIREFSSVREFFTATAMGSIADIPFVAIFLLLIYAIAGPVVWVVVAAITVIVLISLFSRRTLLRISHEMQGANSAQSRLVNEMTYGSETIKLNRAENRFQTAWEDIVLLMSAKTQEQRATGALLTFVSQAVQQLAYITAVVAGVYMVLAGEFSVGAIIAVSILSTRAIAPITQLSGAIARWQQVRVSLSGLTQIANSVQESQTGRQYARRSALRGQIDIEDLQFKYHEDGETILQVPRLHIQAGEVIAILGRNGSGKSTLLKMLSGLYDFQAGEIKFDGLEMRQIHPVDLRRNLGVLTQDVTLFSGTLRDNLSLGPTRATERELEQALSFSGLSNMVAQHPLGMDMAVADGGSGLSVGQRQALGLARIYLADPQIILLDEPTAAMDQTLEAETIAKLRVWLKGRTCLITTHRTEIVALADRVAVLEKGRVALLGPRDEIIAKITAKPKKTA